ncbi:MAG: PIN domain-containing protein [SAR324 cluster bacterium]|nr:PIN domain-containing protein [SAR324 cluster bacterium]
MKILFDTNVVLDVLLDREPFSEIASQLVSLAEDSTIKGVLGATTITTIFYLATKVAGKEKAKEEIKKLLTIFEISPVNRIVLEEATKLDFNDFEDAVLHESAKYSGVHGIVTRNSGDFKKASLSIYSPEELYKILQSVEDQSC